MLILGFIIPRGRKSLQKIIDPNYYQLLKSVVSMEVNVIDYKAKAAIKLILSILSGRQHYFFFFLFLKAEREKQRSGDYEENTISSSVTYRDYT